MIPLRRFTPAALTVGLLTTGLLAAAPGSAQAQTPFDPIVSFTSTTPTDALVGQTYTPTAADPAGGDVTYGAAGAAGDNNACVMSDAATVSFDGAGVCTVVAWGSAGSIGAKQSFVVRRPHSCAEAVSAGLLDADGYLDIDLDHQPLHVWCADTAGVPKTYVDLPVNGAGHNFGQITAGYENWVGSTVTTAFTRARLDPAQSVIDTTDTTFSTSDGGPVYIGGNAITNANLGQASDCDWVGADADVDLTGTGLAIPRPTDEFAISGFPYGGLNGTLTATPQHVQMSGVGGWCSGGGPVVEGTMDPDTGPQGATTFAVAPVAPDGTAYTRRDLGGLAGISGVVHMNDTLTPLPQVADGTSTEGFVLRADGACSLAGPGVVETAAGAGWCTVSGHLDASGDLGPSNYVALTFPVVATTAMDWTVDVPTEGVQGDSWEAAAQAFDATSPATITAGPEDVCTVADGVVQYVAPGTCTVTATQEAGTFHDAASISTDVTVLGKQSVGTVDLPQAPQVGVVITPTTDGWDAGSTLAYSWSVDGTEVSTAATYTPTPADQGHTLTLSVHATRTGYADSGTAQASGTVGLGTLTAGAVAISGTAQVGSTLTATPSGFGPKTSGYAYTWKRDGQPLTGPGTTGATYLVRAQDAGHHLAVSVVGKAAGYADTTAVESDPTGPVANGTDLATGSVRIGGASAAGRVKAGRLLTAVTSGWDARGTLSYRWRVGGRPVAGPAGARASLRVQGSWAGRNVTLTVTGSAPGQDPVTADAGPVLVVKNPTISAHYPKAPASGWHRHPVEVTFTCVDGTAAVTTCPAPVLLGQGTHRVRRTVTALDGGTATVALPAIRVDVSAPVVHLSVPSPGAAFGTAPRCTTRDTGSGHVSCTVDTRKVADANGWRITYHVTARDHAGNVTRVVRTVQADRLALDAPQRGGRYQVRKHGKYRLTMLSNARPRLLYAAPSPAKPHGGGVSFRPDGRVAGMRRWVLDVTITSSTSYSRDWSIGAAVGGHTYVAAFHVNG